MILAAETQFGKERNKYFVSHTYTGKPNEHSSRTFLFLLPKSNRHTTSSSLVGRGVVVVVEGLETGGVFFAEIIP
jgi:hypothetical protein